jgi:methyl-accepting chemotaxis protein
MKMFESLKKSLKLLVGTSIVAITSGLFGYFCNTNSGNGSIKIIVILLIGIAISIIVSLIMSPAIYNPIKELTSTVNKISNGEINVYISTEGTDEIGNLSKALNNLINNIKEYENTFNLLAENIMNGKLNDRIDYKKYKGFYGKIIGNVGTMIDSLIDPVKDAEIVLSAMALNDYTKQMTKDYKGSYSTLKQKINEVRERLLSAQDAFVRVSKGDTSRLEELKKIGRRSENDKLMPAIIHTMEIVFQLIEEVAKLTQNATEGNLDVRGDVTKFEGDYKYIIEGINNTLDTVIKPIDEVTIVLGKIAINDYSQKITGEYEGDFKKLSDAVNDVHARLMSLMHALVDISNGETRQLEELEKIGKRSENDKILPALIGAMETIRSLVGETAKLTAAAIEGKLDVRGDSEKFKGLYREMIEGVNKMLDTIIKPITESLKVMQEMSEGNLHIAVIGEYKGDYKKIKDNLNSVIESFNEVLHGINASAGQVATGSKQVSDSTQMLAQGSTEQASAIEEVTASLEQISAQTNQNAVNASKANELALDAKEDAIRGNSQMKDMVNAMNEINDSSSNISKIIKVIDEIAFQTNILSLNAAVEAARAGQYGKGFAVVAQEVRNLAARSASAAKETTSLIEDSIKKVEAGSNIANETAMALNKIVEVVSKATNLVGEIAIASNEQAAGIAQVNQAIMEVSQVVQANSTTSEENATSSEELSNQAEMLKELVSKFRLKKYEVTNNSFERINPEVLDMLENMYKKNKIDDHNDRSNKRGAVTKSKILISDDEFGKY